MKIIRLSYIVFVLIFLWPAMASAWGPGVHLYLGNLALAGSALLIPPVASLIRKFEKHFLYGSICADFFVGKSYKPNGGKCHNWQTGVHLWNSASNDEEKVFAAGFLGHLAADTVAHGHFVTDFARNGTLPTKLEHIYLEWIADYYVSSNESKSFIRSTCLHSAGDRYIFSEMDDYLCSALTLDKGFYLSRKSLYLYSIRLAHFSKNRASLGRKIKVVLPKTFQIYFLASLDRMVSVLNLYEHSPFVSISPNVEQSESMLQNIP